MARLALVLLVTCLLAVPLAARAGQVMLVGTGPTAGGDSPVQMLSSPNGSYLGPLLSVGGIPTSAASGIAIGHDGDVYVGSFFTNEVLRWHRSTGSVSVFDVSAHVLAPGGLAVGLDGNLYVASSGTGAIVKYDPDGAYLGIFANGIPNVSGIAFCKNGNLYVSQVGTPGDNSDCAILKYNAAGSLVRVFDTGDELNDPLGLTTYDDPSNTPFCYVASSGTNSVARYIRSVGVYDPSWQLRTFDGSALFVGLNLPTDVVCDAAGNVYVADSGNDRILKFNGSNGAFLGVWAEVENPVFIRFAEVPEPASLACLLTGLIGWARFVRRRIDK